MWSAQEEDARELHLQFLVLIEHGEIAVVLTLVEERPVDALCHGVKVP